jgi:hypothetical protein
MSRAERDVPRAGRAERSDLWSFGDEIPDPTVLKGMEVVASDGPAGSIEETVVNVDSSFIVVATDRWIYGKKVFLPAGAIARVDVNEGKAYVNLTQQQIEDSPEFDEGYEETPYVDMVASYYSPILLPKP